MKINANIKTNRLLKYVAVLLLGLWFGFMARHNKNSWSKLQHLKISTWTFLGLDHEYFWPTNFEEVKIPSALDGNVQTAMFYKSSRKAPLLVSLHTWNGNYRERDSLAILALRNNFNYIHPNFRGRNNTPDSCCSDKVISDIDEAIRYAQENGNVDKEEIHIVGMSGGGYTALCTYLKSEVSIKTIQAWCPISDLSKWYAESRVRDNGYDIDILNCVGQEQKKDIAWKQMKLRSPVYMTPSNKRTSKLHIYAGVYDGIVGSVPITHSIDFYNILLNSKGITDETSYVSNEEKLKLLEHKKVENHFGLIGEREIYLRKSAQDVSLTIFKGGHEILSNPSFNELIK